MKLPVLALLTRALRQDARSGRMCLVRLGLLGIVLLTVIAAKGEVGLTGAPGLRFFSSVIAVNLTFITLVGIGTFSAVITEEKEERTLGLLRMTALSPVAILLGKSTARVITVMLLVAAQFPFTVLALTLGGVSLRQVLAAYLTLLAYTVFVSNLGLFWSVVFKRTGNAAGMTGISLLLFFITPPLGGLMLRSLVAVGLLAETSWVHAAVQLFLRILSNGSPYQRISTVLGTGFAASVAGAQVAIDAAIGIGFFLLSWLSFDAFTRVEADTTQPRGAVLRRAPLARVLGAGRAWRHALLWKDYHFIAGGKITVLGLTLLLPACIGLAMWLVHRTGGTIDNAVVGNAAMVAAAMVAAAQLCLLTCRIFADEVSCGTLPSLMLLPLTTGRLAWHKVAGCLLALLPACVLFAVGMALSPQPCLRVLHNVMSSTRGWYVIVHAVFFLYLLVFLSLHVARNSFAIAVGLAFFGHFTCLAFLKILAWNVSANAYPALTGVLIVITIMLHFQIGNRLEVLGGER